ncbi:MAG TPA: S8 family serine peptidase [Pseudobdellovibrionaceae bacterium]|nr:S8 family serine peptidase [Pseudobdellovibrionaceae bacterium]
MQEANDEKLNLAGFLLVSILGLAAGAGIGVGFGPDWDPKPSSTLTQSATRGGISNAASGEKQTSSVRWPTLRGLRSPDSVPQHPADPRTTTPPNSDSIPQQRHEQPAKPPGEAKKSRAPVRVAVIDTGIDSQHPELAEYIESDSAWDFVTDEPRANDPHGHGTHIAGLIVREAKVKNLKLIPLRYYEEGLSGGEALRHSVRAFHRAIALGVDVINYSGGGARPHKDELAALRAANAAGILVVAASGNEGSDADQAPFYPASYGLPNLISVTATNSARELLPTSNWGRASVQLATFGEDLISTLPGGRSGKMTGTSQATALATAAAVRLIADLRQRDLDTSPEMLRAALEVSGAREPRLMGRTATARFFDQEQVLRRREAAWQREPTGTSLSQWRRSVALRIQASHNQDVARSD